MNYYDRLSSLMLGEQSNTPITDTLAKRRTSGEVAYDMENDTAAAMGAGGRGFKRRSRGRGRGVPNVGTMDDLKSTSTEGPPSDPNTGPLARKRGKFAEILKTVMSRKP